ncbi:MAG: SDR family oxidoreductase [Sphingomonadales bacterium]|jgi:NAD(P)-dependent dehydrogenase (short-subunit alcohol dehydrogenase family)
MASLQKVLVTAGASGIGLAISLEFLKTGADVFICDVSDVALKEALTQNPRLRGCVADVGVPLEVEAMFAEVLKAFGGLDILVNNAGIGGQRGLVEDLDYDQWDRTIGVNLNGMFYCIKNAIPLMKKQGSGCVINISTASVKVGLPNRLPYIASKAGVMGLSHTLAREVGPSNIRSNCILPGFIDNQRGSDIASAYAKDLGVSLEEVEKSFLKTISMRTKIKMSEIGEMAVFLASDKAKHITAQEIAVDGNLEWEG